MAHFTSDDVFDAALELIQNNCDKMVLTAGVPTSYTDANTNNGSGSGQKIAEVAMANLDFTIANGDTSGRKITSDAKSGVAVVAAGDGDHVVYLDTVNSRILHYYGIATARTGLTTADTVNFPTHDFEIRDTVAE